MIIIIRALPKEKKEKKKGQKKGKAQKKKKEKNKKKKGQCYYLFSTLVLQSSTLFFM